MIRFIRTIVVAVSASVLVCFAFANRQFVTVSFDPFSSPDEASLAIPAPLFAVVIVSAMLGVIAGAAAMWISQARHRRAARRHRAESGKWRAEAEMLRTQQPPPLPRS
jgi:hypothetical protein